MYFDVHPIKGKKERVRKAHAAIPEPLPKPPLSFCILGRRRSGKSVLAVNLLLQQYIGVFSETLIISQTAAWDRTYDSLHGKKKVTILDISQHSINNELLDEIWDRQAGRILEDPKDDLLIVFDDCGNLFKSRTLRAQMNRYVQQSRHVGISYIFMCQSILNMTSEQISNCTTWAIFAQDARALTKISETLATAQMDKDDLAAYIRENTKKKHSFVLINLEAEKDEHVYTAYDPAEKHFLTQV